MYKFKMTEQTYRRLDQDSCGLCFACHEVQDGDCEPDAENYECGECQVYGIQQALVFGRIKIVDSEDQENVAA